ncbi:MAG: hypothetical protein IPG45_27150 [Deltaproteobacteria bacterium]|jgi:hypothetical protein|nr:hypothetical protein [Deltaproteobacteria bacterium]
MAVPDLFARVPTGLFAPLGDPHAALYWALLGTYYQHEFEREPFALAKAFALELAEREIRRSSHWAQKSAALVALAREDPDATGDDEDLLVRGLARRLLLRLERSGWVHFQYRSGQGEVLSFPPYAARIVEVLLRVAKDEQPVLQGFVHSIAALLEARAFAERPGLSLFEAKRHTLDLMRELKILERNIHRYTQEILDEATSAAKVLEFGLDHYQQAVMGNYHRLKTVDNVYRQRASILQRIDAIEQDQAALDRAADWYAGQGAVGPLEARHRVNEDLALIRSHFDRVPELVDQIDARNARFSHVTLRRLMYLLRQDRRTEGQLQRIIDALAKDEAPEIEVDLFRAELLFDDPLYVPPQRRPRAQPQPLARPPAPSEANKRAVAQKLERAFARAKVEAYVEQLLAGRHQVDLEAVPVVDDQDYVRLLYLAAYGLQRDSSFSVVPGKERLQKGPYSHPDGHLERRRRRR